MSIELPPPIEEELRDLAGKRGREVQVLAEEVVRAYLEAAAVTDLDPEQVAEAQMALIRELGAVLMLERPLDA
jgi:predicted transcriptional regulator